MESHYKIWADVAKNRLFIVLKGFLQDSEVKVAAEKTIEEAKKLASGFSVVNDISEMKPATQAGAEHIKRAQSFLASRGVGRVIRIQRNENLTTKMQFQRNSKDYYQADSANSVEEAEVMLDHSQR